MSRGIFSLVFGLLVSVVVILQPLASAETGESRVIDRSFSCSVRLWAGARIIDASAWSGFRDPEDPTRWKWLANAGVGGRDVISFIGMSAGAPPPKPDVGASLMTRWLNVNAKRCAPSSRNVEFSFRGLEGGQASQLQSTDRYECPATRTIVIHLRAEFRTPTTLRAQTLYRDRYFTTSSPAVVRKGQFAVAAQSGKPLVYATVSETGRTRLFTASSCVPD